MTTLVKNTDSFGISFKWISSITQYTQLLYLNLNNYTEYGNNNQPLQSNNLIITLIHYDRLLLSILSIFTLENR